ncbi:MAG: rhodanese-like domain-containing protein [Trichlorobacter sp.]|jgi:rhodanese-related sulfurtransferase
MHPKELQKQLQSKKPPLLLDVRSGMEYRMGHIPGAQHLALWKLLFRLTGSLPADRSTPLVVVCESGSRSQMAGELLRKRGYRAISLLDGDMAGWRGAGLAVERD